MKSPKIKTSPHRLIAHRGMAMVMVVCVMALVAVLGYAMLASASLQATAASNGQSAAIADAQAQSGINLAMYYLLNPQYAPSTTSNNGVTYWPGANNITFSTTGTPSSQMTGSVSVTVGTPTVNTTTYTDTFPVTAIGSSGSGSGGGTITRTVKANVQLTNGYVISQAGTFNSALTVTNKMTFSSPSVAILSNSTVTLNLGATINGNISALSILQILGSLLNGLQLTGPPSGSNPAPQAANVYQLNASNQYSYQGQWYNATLLPVNVTSGTTLGPVPGTNPLGVYYSTGNLNLNGNTSITGSLIVQGSGKLQVSGSNNTITAVATMPAIVVSNGQLMMNNSGKLSVNGVLFAAAGIKGPGVGATLSISGALLTDSNTFNGYSGTATVTYDPTNPLISVPTLSSANQTPQSVKLTSWTQ